MSTNDEITFRDMLFKVRKLIFFLFSKWVWIFLTVVIFGIAGILYATYQKPVYVAELTFAPEYDNGVGMGAYLGLASQFGVDLGTGGGIFEGENLIQFFKSKMLIKRTLLSPVVINNKKQLLIDYYIDSKKLRKSWDEKPELRNISFSQDTEPGVRAKDSILKNIVLDVGNSLTIEKPNKNIDFVVANVEAGDEILAKAIVEQLVKNGIKYYVEYRSKKSRENVAILQKQTDSVESLLTGNIVSIAASNDLNVNPIKQIARARVQRKQVDVQVTSQVYGELLKQLELSKISLRKETPLIQIIDEPILPLQKKKLGRFKGLILFGILGMFLSVTFLVLKKILST